MKTLNCVVVLILIQLCFIPSVLSQESSVVEDREETTNDDKVVNEDLIDLDLTTQSDEGKGNDGSSPLPVEETMDDVSEEDLSKAEEEEDSHENKDQAALLEETKKRIPEGPFVDLLGPSLLSLNMVDGSHAQLEVQDTSEALRGKSVIGLYFSADW